MAELTREIRDKRIAVMRDVLEQLDRKDVPLAVSHGYGYLSGHEDIALFEDHESLQPQIDQIQGSCRVCMLGAAFLSFTRIYNGVPSNVIQGDRSYISISGDCMRAVLSETFDRLTLDIIESVFEQCDMSGWDEGAELNECIAAGHYGREFEHPRDAARAIATNIIDNDGEFILPVATPA